VQLAVLSDTHLSYPNDTMETEFNNNFLRMDALFHCGDYTSETIWAYLNSHPKFFGVAGNMDFGYWTQNLNYQLTVRVGDIKIGMLHGYDLDFSDIERDITSRFPEDVNFIFFGHTHRRFFKKIAEEKYILNPGSFTFSKDDKKGYAIIKFSDIRNIEVKWIDLS
jgi:putative phosphoesterase